MSVNTKTKSQLPSISIPITLPQLAEGLKKLSKPELETLEILLDKRAMAVIKKSLSQVKEGKFKELKRGTGKN